ncbi:MAG: NAD(P)/FAD-dependent oxidoreductase, partial [Chlorobi bacterium]|nr:NAD(P)/FAD-dependent oxidoreductase [Chlorobiota bacterium]
LEKNPKAGGTLQGFQRGGCQFSSGMHYIGSLDEGQVMNRMFRYFGILDKLKLKRMDENGFEVFHIAGKEYKYPIGHQRFKEQMISYFPEEKKAVKKYIRDIRAAADEVDIYNLRYPVNYDIRNSRSLTLGAYEYIRSLSGNTELQNVLAAQNFNYAGTKEASPFYTHALINNYYLNSAYKLIGGSNQLVVHLVNNIKRNGGMVLTGKKAERFVFKNNLLTGVETATGETFFADRFISNIHPALTFGMMDESRLRKSYRNRILNLKNTISAFGLHIQLEKDTFPYLNHNYHQWQQDDVWYASGYDAEKWPEYFFLFTMAKTENDRYSDCVTVLTYMKYEEVEKWKDLAPHERGKEYADWKAEKAEKLLNLVDSRFPGIKSNMISYSASTPLTLRDYIGTPDGGMYGIMRDYHKPMETYIFPKTKIPNLFFTGQNVNLHGMLGVSLTALVTCGEFMELNELIKEINEA